MSSKTSKSFSAVVLIVTIALLALDVAIPDFSITETHITFIGMLLGTFGLGGIYVKAIKEGFGRYKDFKNKG